MEILKDSDIDAFEEIVGRYGDRLFRFAFMRVGVRETAEDMVQEVFMRLFRSLSGGTKIENTESFLLKSISNACIDHFRRYRPESVSIDDIPDIPNEADRDITEEYVRIKRLLDGLPPEQAETIRLRCYDGLTFARIAEILDISESTVKSRYRYAIEGIKRKINQEN